MGIFGNLLGRKQKNEVEKETRDLIHYSKELQNGEEISVSELSRIVPLIQHRDNSRTQLIMGRIIKTQQGATIMNDEQDYIAFELPEGKIITEGALRAVIEQYDRDKSSGLVTSKQLYVGRVEETSAGVTIGKKSAFVEKEVRKKVDSLESQRSASLQEYYQAQQAEKLRVEEIQVQQRDARIKAYEKDRKSDITSRLSNPTIQGKGKPNGRGEYEEYDGVDLQTGDILRLRKVNKICKNSSGQYLYTSYVNTVEHEHDAELFNEEGEPRGKLVAFVLPGRLQDFVNAGNSNQIRAILNLLSVGKNLAREGQMTYIGQLDERGKISDEMPMASKISEMQQNYANGKKQNNRNFSEDEGR